MMNGVIGYSKHTGLPIRLMPVEKQWWIVSPGEELQKLKVMSEAVNTDYFDDIEVLTTDNRVHMRPLVRMLGLAVEPCFDTPERVMTECLEKLEDMGAEVVPPSSHLRLRTEVRKLPEGSARDGKYVLRVIDCTSRVDRYLINADGFDDWHNAVEVARAFETWVDEYMLQWGYRCKIKEMVLPEVV